MFDETPCLHIGDPNACRGEEIRQILVKYRPEKYAILDDDSDMLDYQLRHFFQTDPDYGLTDTIAYRVIAHLGTEQGNDEPQWKHVDLLRTPATEDTPTMS